MRPHEIRVDVASLGAREEVFSFPGCAELQAEIRGAFAAGDEVLLASLRAEFRGRARGITQTRSTAILPTSESSITTPTAIRSTFAAARSLIGYCCTWSATLPCRMDHGEPHLLAFAPTSFDRWIASLDPVDDPLAVLWRHANDPETGNSPVGDVTAFTADRVGLKVLVELRDEEGVDVLLDAADRGLLAFSINAMVQASSQEHREGRQDITVADEAGLNEVSLLRREDAGDANAVVLEVGGKPAAYRQRQDALDRDARLRRTFGFDRSSGPRWSNPTGSPRWGP